MNCHYVNASHPCASLILIEMLHLINVGKGDNWVSPRCRDRECGEIEYDMHSTRVCELPEGSHPSQGYTWSYTTPNDWVGEYGRLV